MELGTLSIDALLAALGDRKPVPGGGAAAATTAAIGLATGRMVLSYSIGRKDLAEHEQSNVTAMQELEAWQAEAIALGEADARAFEVLSTMWSLPTDHEDRVAGWDDAVTAAIDAPLAMCRLCRDACRLLATLPERTNPMLASDLAVSVLLLSAACAAAAWNVRVNLPSVSDEDRRARLAAESGECVVQCRELSDEAESACD